MAKYRFEQIAINSTEKRMPSDDDRLTYIGLEHLDSGSLTVRRWGSAVPLKGEKLVMHKGDVPRGIGKESELGVRRYGTANQMERNRLKPVPLHYAMIA